MKFVSKQYHKFPTPRHSRAKLKRCEQHLYPNFVIIIWVIMWMSAREFGSFHQMIKEMFSCLCVPSILPSRKINYVLMYEWDQQPHSCSKPSFRRPPKWRSVRIVFPFESGIIKHFVNEKFWWIWGRQKRAEGGRKENETFGLFLLKGALIRKRTENRWENYLIATNVNNNFNNSSRLSSSRNFPHPRVSSC